MKRCNRCGIEREINDFCKNSQICKSCKKEYGKLYYQKNREKIKMYSKEYRKKNYEKTIEIQKKWREKNRENIKIISKKYRKNNLEKSKTAQRNWYTKNIKNVKEYRKKYKEDHSEKLVESWKKSRLKNSEKRKVKQKIYCKKNRKQLNEYAVNRRKSDPILKLSHNIRGRIRVFLKSNNMIKSNKTFEIVGCSPQELKKHIEKQFTNGMNWNNYGYYGWHMDHKIPLDFGKTKEEIYKLCHYTNIQPLWWNENLKKTNKLI
jgi:hypothetical protein